MKSLFQLLPALRRYRLTLAGFLFALTMLLVGTLAFLTATNLLLLVFASMLATWLISGFVSRLCLAGLEVDFQLPADIGARQPIGGRVILRNLKRLTPSFSVHLQGAQQHIDVRPLYVPVAGGGQTINESTELVFAHRGLYKENSLALSTSFPFGFLERRVSVTLERNVIVYPCLIGTADWITIHGVIAREITAMQQGQGHDFYRLRDYYSGESVKSVDWKASAHSGRLMVREFAREESLEVEIFLDLHDAGRGSVWFEKAVECAAYLVWHITLEEVSVRFHSQEVTIAVPQQGTVHDVLRYLALVQPIAGPVRMPREPECDMAIVISADQSRFETLEWEGALRVDADAVDPGPATEDSVR